MAAYLSSDKIRPAALVLLLALIFGLNQALAQTIKLTPRQRALAHGELPLTNFYDTPAPLPPGRPGELIRSQAFDNYDLPEGVAAIRILYHSLSAGGGDVVSSGVVLVPRGSAPKGGWPIIAWAHPFTAVARQCAPSLKRDLGSGSELSMFVNLGYAVVATDYTGLGTTFRNAGYDMQSNATDVTNAVHAAREAVPQLDERWVAIGIGSGGAAALSAAELERNNPDCLGSVSISGDLDLEGAIGLLASGNWRDSLNYLAYSIKTVSPSFPLEDMFLPKGFARYNAVTAVCRVPPVKPSLTSGESLKPGWKNSKYVQDFFGRNILGLRPASVPVLIISAEDSRNSPDAQVVSRMCGQKDHVDLMTYPSADPNDLIGSTVAAQMAWIRARFAGRTTQNTCQ